MAGRQQAGNDSGELTKRLSDLFGALQADRDLEFLVAQLHPGWHRQGKTPPPDSPAFSRAFMFCQRLLVFAEDAYCRLDLEQHHSGPAGNAWMHLLRGWAQSEMMRITWSLTFQIYGFFFNEFCAKHLQMTPLAFIPKPLGIAPGEAEGSFRLLLQRPGTLGCLEVGSATTKGMAITSFRQLPWYRLTQVAPEIRRCLRASGVTRVHADFKIDESSGVTAASLPEFRAWWEFPS